MLADINRFVDLHKRLNNMTKEKGYENAFSVVHDFMMSKNAVLIADSHVDTSPNSNGNIAESPLIPTCRMAVNADENLVFELYQVTGGSRLDYKSEMKVHDLINNITFTFCCHGVDSKTNGFCPKAILPEDRQFINALEFIR